MKPQYPLLVSWTLWETFQSKQKEDYKSNISKIYKVGSVDEFARLWNNIPYNKPGQFFFNKESNSIKKIRFNNDMKALEAVSFFKDEIEPAWEDPENKKGGEFRITIDEMETGQINQLWESLVLDAIGGSIPFFDKINGIRVMDSSKVPSNSTRFEIWMNFNDPATREEVEKKLKEYLSTEEVIKQKGYNLLWKQH